MTTLFSPNAGMNGPLGGLLPDRFRTLGTGLASATVGAIVADRKQNQAVRWGTMAPGCDGLPNLNTLNDVTCCADNCPEDGTWVLINTQHGIPTLAGGAARPFAGTSGPPVIFRAPMGDPCITDVRISLLDTHGNKWRIVEEMVDGVKMAAGSMRSTGNTPCPPRTTNDPNRYVSAFQFFSTQITDVPPRPAEQKTWLQFPSLTGANTGPTGSPTFSPVLEITASGILLCPLPVETYNAYYAGLPVQNLGFFGECGFNVSRFSSDGSWDGPFAQYYFWHTGQSRGNQLVRGTCATTGCGRVQSDGYVFGIEAPLPTGHNCAALKTDPDADVSTLANPVPAGNLGVMVRDANGVGDELLRPLTWTALPASYPGKAIVYRAGTTTAATEMSICACEEGSVFVNPVGVKTVWQFRYDPGTNRLVLVRTIAIGTGGTSWNADTILSAVLEYF